MMKNTFQSLLAACVFTLVFSCGKDKNEPVENNGLIGKWKLVERLNTSGALPAEFQKVSEGQSGTLEFKANGDFKEVKGIIYSSININDNYKMLDKTRIELSRRAAPSTDTLVWDIIEISPQSLTLGLGCSGLPCVAKYVAIK